MCSELYVRAASYVLCQMVVRTVREIYGSACIPALCWTEKVQLSTSHTPFFLQIAYSQVDHPREWGQAARGNEGKRQIMRCDFQCHSPEGGSSFTNPHLPSPSFCAYDRRRRSPVVERVDAFEIEVHFLGVGTSLLTSATGTKNESEFPVYSLHVATPDSKNMILIL